MRHVFLDYIIVGIAGKVRIVYPGDLRMILKELSVLESIFAVALNSYVKALKPELQKI